MASQTKSEDGVFELLTVLCNSVASKYCSQNRISQKRLANKMRTHSYEIKLKKTTQEIPSSNRDPVVDLLSYYLLFHQKSKNVAEYKRCVELKKVISTIRCKDFAETKDSVNKILKFLIGMSNSVKEDLSSEIYKNPFTFGMLDEMLPKPPREVFGSPQPYPYFPSYVFELPFSLKRHTGMLDGRRSQTYTEYTVESFDSKSYLETTTLHTRRSSDLKTFLSPVSMGSMTSMHLSPYSESLMFNYPRLTAPRDLTIPPSTVSLDAPNVKISFVSTNAKSEMKEVYRGQSDDESMDIWELATQVDKDVPDDIWDVASKLPIINERQLIASSTREVALWRKLHAEQMSDLNVVSEKQFIRHLMYLIIGVETSSFSLNEKSGEFSMRAGLALEGVSPARLHELSRPLLAVGRRYRRLHRLAFCAHAQPRGLVHEAVREVIRQYLLDFRLVATEIYEECCRSGSERGNCMPTLLQIARHMEPLQYEIETVVSIFKVIDPEVKPSIHGAELMSYLFNEISLVTHKKTALTMFNSLFSICKVYFKFIERFIFEGELDDRFHEFFIKKDFQYINCRSKRYWDKGFHISQSTPIAEFLRPLAKYILLCGKSLRLLMQCNPADPLVLLLTSAHPSILCCGSFPALVAAQRALQVYRTRCLFVSGAPASLTQLLLKRDQERKAFAELASVRQAETVDKILAERKRLAQLIVAEKQHSLRVLEAAMAEAKAAKLGARRRERARDLLQRRAGEAAEEVDSRLRNEERNKMLEYYSKLNMEVEKSKIHTEWKIKRLQLDQSRIQLLSTEERNLKREKLELEHQRSGEMAMSIQSIDYNNDNEPKDEEDKTDNYVEGERSDNQNNVKESSSIVLSAICNAAKSIFGVSKSDDKNCDNKKTLDAQGNIVTDVVLSKDTVTSSEEIGHGLDRIYDNEQFLKMRQTALFNKQKVMTHEFGQLDKENNRMNDPPLISIDSIDEENNLKGDLSPFAEARRNKLKVLGAEYNLKPDVKQTVEPRTDAQKEALINREKVMGVEYNLPIESTRREPMNDAQEEAVINKLKVLGVEYNLPLDYTKREPVTEAQEAAVRNKKKVLGSEYGAMSSECSTKAGSTLRRSTLTLNLKPFGETSGNLAVTPGIGAITPGELFPRLDLETPTTADMPLDGQMTSDIFTPRSEGSKDIDKKADNDFMSSEGFNFPVIVDDDTAESEIISEIQTDTPDNSPSKKGIDNRHQHLSIFNIIDGSYELNNFDPFGVKDLTNFNKNHFSNKMDSDMAYSCYTHPASIMEEVKKRPYNNIFASQCTEDQEKITNDNIATLTACLQRSVMLPLTYQLEVVNNSILTHFLVNLEMYEHLKSLKDYFFLMDGEFCRSICHNLFTKLTKTLNPQKLLNFATLHNILDKALGSSISHVHKFSENLSFTITESPLSFQHSSPDVLQCLSLTYSVCWPLNIILSQEALLRYAKVFQFLIKMRRIFWVLGEDFASLKLSAKLSNQHSRKLLRSPQYTSVQIYRHIMASMMRALDNYIVTTCILTSWTEFETDLKKARTLDDLYECHVVYIKKVLFRCLLNNRSTPVMKLLNDIFTVILKFSRVLKAGEWQQKEDNGHFTHSSYVQLEELFHLFEKLAKYLHKVVTKLMECGYQRHLVELLTMVNLNGYYDPDKSKEGHSVCIQNV